MKIQSKNMTSYKKDEEKNKPKFMNWDLKVIWRFNYFTSSLFFASFDIPDIALCREVNISVWYGLDKLKELCLLVLFGFSQIIKEQINIKLEKWFYISCTFSWWLNYNS